jgi:predicted DNA-binding protein
MDKKTKPTSIRLSEEGQQLRKLLAKKLGLSESAVIELALRRLAQMEGITTK